MEYFPPALEKLVEQFARLPGIGRKSAQRLAFFTLSLPEEEVEVFAQSIQEAKRSIALCPVCQNLTEGDGLCPVCASEKRDGRTVCVVADPKDVIAIERAREYQGQYHVLHGVLSPMNGVGPDDLHIKSLLEREPEFPGYWQLMGDYVHRQGDLAAALGCYQRCQSCSQERWEFVDLVSGFLQF